MSQLGKLFSSTIGRKFLMAVSGIVLIGFVIAHLVGNLQVFEHPDKINGYAHFLRQLGPMLWVARIALIIAALVHIWAAAVLTIESKRARGPEGWAQKSWLQATLQSRAMRWTGMVVVGFLVYHLMHFTWGAAQATSFKANLPPYTLQSDYHVLGVTAVRAGTVVEDVYSMVIFGFQNAVVSVFYVIAVGLLTIHLLHGMESMFQTFGWRNERWWRPLRAIVTIFCLAYFIGNLAIPAAALSGKLIPRATAMAANR